MARPMVQTEIDRLRILAENLGWTVEQINTAGDEIRMTISKPKPKPEPPQQTPPRG